MYMMPTDASPIGQITMIINGRQEEVISTYQSLTRRGQLLPGRDGVVRAAKVQILGTDRRLIILRHPIWYLVLLEVTEQGTSFT